ncbi:MAG: hypothetical protein J3Q66DRAFT_333374 [Benniella sp.]|nr:MAG: hypothetical protein J3Q66DRAFT_333374 [Benniella sp.]
MKFAASLAILALAASQAMAVVPTPVPECKKSVVVAPQHITCKIFADEFGTTFENMLLWNKKLSPKCDNLDQGYAICVSVDAKDCCLNENPYNATVPIALPGPTPTASGAPVAPSVSGAPLPTTAPPAASASATVPDNKAPTPTVNKPSEASGSKSSMILAVAGVVLSVAYMF